MADLLAYLAGTLVLIGAVFCLLAAVGIVRLPDLYTRMHAASKAGSVGAGLIFVAIAIVANDASVVLRCLAGIVFLLLTTPIGAHLLARAAYLSGVRPMERTVVNDLPSSTHTVP